MNRLDRYAEYLLGSHWRQLKGGLYRLRGRKCEACASRNFIEGHHLTYREPLTLCTEDDIMLLCRTCHEWVHADKSLDAFLKSASKTPNDVRRRIVISAIVRNYGGEHRLERHRRSMERTYAAERARVDAIQPLRECRKVRKRWTDYTPDLIAPKRVWTV